nr:MAG TPA: hypothetical protein [Caudoviricetes sp.]
MFLTKHCVINFSLLYVFNFFLSTLFIQGALLLLHLFI